MDTALPLLYPMFDYIKLKASWVRSWGRQSGKQIFGGYLIKSIF